MPEMLLWCFNPHVPFWCLEPLPDGFSRMAKVYLMSMQNLSYAFRLCQSIIFSSFISCRFSSPTVLVFFIKISILHVNQYFNSLSQVNMTWVPPQWPSMRFHGEWQGWWGRQKVTNCYEFLVFCVLVRLGWLDRSSHFEYKNVDESKGRKGQCHSNDYQLSRVSLIFPFL